jgi:hypothetical protein
MRIDLISSETGRRQDFGDRHCRCGRSHRTKRINLMDSPAKSSLSADRRRRAASAIAAVVLLFAALLFAPLLFVPPALAQDAGVSGIPPGPGNVNGLNGSIRDPSGIGNAARLPALPQPNLNPVPVPDGVPLTSTQPPAYLPSAGYAEQWRHLPKRERQRLERAQVKENDRLLSHGAVSICRGC